MIVTQFTSLVRSSHLQVRGHLHLAATMARQDPDSYEVFGGGKGFSEFESGFNYMQLVQMSMRGGGRVDCSGHGRSVLPV